MSFIAELSPVYCCPVYLGLCQELASLDPGAGLLDEHCHPTTHIFKQLLHCNNALLASVSFIIALITIFRMLSHCAVGLCEKAKTGVWMISESASVTASNKARQKVCLLTISRCWEGGQSRTVLQVRYIRVREGEGEEQLSSGRVRRGGSKLILIAPLDRTISCVSRTLACSHLWHVKGPPQC